MTRWLALVPVLAGLAATGAPAPFPSSTVVPTADLQWSILFVSEIRGELAPCDCSGVPVGGLDRLTALLRGYREAHPREQSFLLAGGSSFVVGDVLYRQRADYLREALGRLGTSIVMAGPRDMRYGAEYFASFGEIAGQALTLNLRREGASFQAPEPRSVLQVEGPGGAIRRIGVVGAIDPRYLPVESPSFEPYDLGDPGEHLRRSLAAIPQADFRIAVVTAEQSRLDAVLRGVDGIDLVLAIEGTRHSGLKAARGQRPSVFHAGGDLKHFGILRFREEDGRMRLHESRVVPLSRDVLPDAGESGRLEYFLAMEDYHRRELGRTGHPSVANRTFAGSDSCRTCHAAIWEQWRDSAHATDTQRLPKQRRQAVLEALRGAFPDYREYYQHYQLARGGQPAVECETCHGPAADHARIPLLPFPWASAARSCSGCHSVDERGKTRYSQAMSSIRHWTHEVAMP